jgi:uncharacterized BrkB/YihY/UPF0761 family membrane protein
MGAQSRMSMPRILFWGSFVLLVMTVALAPQMASALPEPPDDTGALQFDAVFIMRTVVTLAVLFSALWVIISKRYPPADRKWAYGAIGAIMAFWLAAGAL